MTQVTGIFDYFVFVDEATGKTESVLSSDLANEVASMFFCDTVTHRRPCYCHFLVVIIIVVGSGGAYFSNIFNFNGINQYFSPL